MYNDNERYKMDEPDKYKNKDHKKAGQGNGSTSSLL